MMLENIQPVESLRGLARSRAKKYDFKSVNKLLLDEYYAEGWEFDKKNSKSIRIKRKKSHGTYLEDRVWTLLFKMQFKELSGSGGASLALEGEASSTARSQLDVVAIDNEVGIAIECKSSEKVSNRPRFQEELGKFTLIRQRFTEAIRKSRPQPFKQQIVLAMFLSHIALSENDRERARVANVLLFDEKDLEYYESLVNHLGPAAKYQLLADMLPGKTIPGLSIKTPAIKTRMGKTNCYSFSASPDYLLKIAYVSHRQKGRASDVNTYQRMVKKSRLSKIREYVEKDGIFPTNIVVNLEAGRATFQKVEQENEGVSSAENGILGWLAIKGAYKSAWIIDGQHRLFAYSGIEAAKSKLAVFAFEGLAPSKQAQLFIDINAKQKSVPPSLLQELYAELHWDAPEPQYRVRAIISKAIQVLDEDKDSPLYERIQKADAAKDHIRCITLSSLFGAIEKTGFHIAKERKGAVVDYGPLWVGDDNDMTLRRTVRIISDWLRFIRDGARDWWDKGAADGGGLAMNDGIIACINVLRSIFQFLDGQGDRLIRLDDDDLSEVLRPYGQALGSYFGTLDESDRRAFRSLRGIEGQNVRTRRAQKAIREQIESFNPSGLQEYLDLEKAETNIKAKQIVDRLEKSLQKIVLEELQREFGPEESQWWMLGVPKNVRKKVSDRFEEEDGARGSKEHYFDLIDYRSIAMENWTLFEPLVAYEKTGNSKKRTNWIAVLNEKRRIVSHVSSGVTLTLEELAELQEYDSWFHAKISGSEIDTEV